MSLAEGVVKGCKNKRREFIDKWIYLLLFDSLFNEKKHLISLNSVMFRIKQKYISNLIFDMKRRPGKAQSEVTSLISSQQGPGLIPSFKTNIHCR